MASDRETTMTKRSTRIWLALGAAPLLVACGTGDIGAAGDALSATTTSAPTVAVADARVSAPTSVAGIATTISPATAAPKPKAPIAEEPASVAPTTSVVVMSPDESPADAVDDDVTTEDAVGAVRSPAMGLPELEALIRDVHGPTDSLVDDLNRLAFFPSDLPQVPDAEILEMRVEMNHYRFDESHYRSNLVVVGTTLPIADAAAFYEAELAARGYTVRSTGSQTDSDGFSAMWVDTQLPDEAGPRQTLDVMLREGDFPGTRVQLWYRGSEPYGGQVEAFNTFLASNPLPEGGFASQSTFSTAYRTGDSPADIGLTFTMVVEYADADEDQIRDRFRRSVEDSGNEIRSDSDLALRTVWLVGNEIWSDPQVTFYTGSGSNGDYSSISLTYRRR